MTMLSNLKSFVICAGLSIGAAWPATAIGAPAGFNTGNDISLDKDDPNYFGNFQPELAQTLDRQPAIDPQTGLHVTEVKPGLFYVTEGIYQSAFLVTSKGVIVFDAPPTYADRLIGAIEHAAPDTPIRYLVYSHAHYDHIGGASAFEDIDGLKIVAHHTVAQAIEQKGRPGILAPTLTFKGDHKLSLGGEHVELSPASFHAEDIDTIIYLPKQKFLMAVDTIAAGEVPFMNFGATADVGAYLAHYERFLSYDFDHFLAGHVSVLASRDDVIEARDYTADVFETVLGLMPSFGERMGRVMQAFEFRNANLAYRAVIEEIRRECAADIIDRWKERLSVVDVYADSHCQTMILYSVMH